VARFASIRMILALVMCMNLELVQIEVKTSILHKELDEVIFMDQPEIFVSKGHEGKVCGSGSPFID